MMLMMGSCVGERRLFAKWRKENDAPELSWQKTTVVETNTRKIGSSLTMLRYEYLCIFYFNESSYVAN